MEATDDNIKLNTKELEDLFGSKTKEAKPKIESKSDQPQQVTLLEWKRANNIAIMLARIKISYKGIKDAILAMDENSLTIEDLKNLSKFVPQPDEISTLKEYDGDVGQLGKAEQFFLQLLNVPRLDGRLETFIFKRQFDDKVNEVKQAIVCVNDACKELKQSRKFTKMLEIVLALGNYLNGNTFRGAAYGFKMDSLSKLGETKANEGNQNLVHYLAAQVESRWPDLIKFAESVPSVEPAAKIPLNQVIMDAANIKKSLDLVEKEVKAFQSTGANDRYAEVMSKFLASAAAIVNDLVDKATKTKDIFVSLANFYGEDGKSATTETFFGIIQHFCVEFDKATKENAKRKVEDEKKKRGAVAGTQRRPNAGPIGDKEKGVMDDLIAQLRGGIDVRRKGMDAQEEN